MSDSRRRILDRLSAIDGANNGANSAAKKDHHRESALRARLNNPLRYPGPVVDQPLEAFEANLAALGVTLHRLAPGQSPVQWLDGFCASHTIKDCSRALFGELSLKVPLNEGRESECLVTAVDAAVAETGTLMILSRRPAESRALFLAHRHVAVVRQDQILARQEQAWDHLRAQSSMPARVHFITGPSKTGDVEQTLVVGAHGPVSLDVLLL